MPPKGLFRDFGFGGGSLPSVGFGVNFGGDRATCGDKIMREGRFFWSCDTDRTVAHGCGARRDTGE